MQLASRGVQIKGVTMAADIMFYTLGLITWQNMIMKSFIFSRQSLLVLCVLGTSYCKVAAFHAHQPVLNKSDRNLKLSRITTRMYIDGADVDTPLHLFSTQSSSPLSSHNIVPIIMEPDPNLRLRPFGSAESSDFRHPFSALSALLGTRLHTALSLVWRL